MTPFPTSLTRPGSLRAWAAACGCAALAGCGTTPAFVTYSPGAALPPTAVTAGAEVAAGPASAEPTPAEPIEFVAAIAPASDAVRPAAYQEEGAAAGNEPDASDEGRPHSVPMPTGLAIDEDTRSATTVDAAPRGQFTLAEAEATAEANNPTLAGAAAAVQKARGQYVQVGLAANPTLGITADDIGEDGSAGRYGVFASRTFVRGNKLELSRAVESWAVRNLELTAETQRLRTLTDVRQRFVRVLAAQRRAEIAGELVTLAETGVELAEELVELGEVARPDVLQAQVQVGEVRIIQRNAEIARDAAWRSLMAATGTPGRPVQPVAGTLDGEQLLGDFEELLAGILARSPEVAAARARIEQARAAVCRQQAQPIPNVTAQASLAYGFGGDEPIGGFQLGAPLPKFNDNRGNVAAAIADVHRAIADLARLELNLRDRLATALADYESADNQAMILSDDVLPAARENLELSERGYQQGEFDAIRVVTARRSLFEAELTRITAAADRRQAAALIDGLLLSGALDDIPDAGGGNLQGVGLRDQALGGQ
ncbi:TolC family protein [Alienimonas chondri]|uniref:TolC family protein n=1 Tax=Alienimonas chondri TaxID=2681879 RepID=A0ABX1VBK7_9PLAN|nr:TolC family protein [Alienimonas chondri]NNJ25495.1 hypothetical protein [Alienimonas chondri]